MICNKLIIKALVRRPYARKSFSRLTGFGGSFPSLRVASPPRILGSVTSGVCACRNSLQMLLPWYSWVIAIGVLGAALFLSPLSRTPDDGRRIVQKVGLLWDQGKKDVAIGRFVNALKVPTVADVGAPNHVGDPAPFQELHRVLRADYSGVFERLEVEVVDEFSLLLTWPGTDKRLDPLLLISHLDVVPAGDVGAWTVPPFSGSVRDGYVYGRGALDTKYTACALLEAVNSLVEDNAELTRGLIIALGHDEEVGGFGARSMARILKERGITPFLVLDEGGMVAMEELRGWAGHIKPFALVGTGEKTAMNFEISIPGIGGHASLPPPAGMSASSRLSGFVQRLENENFPASLSTPMVDFLRAIAEDVRVSPLAWVLRRADSRLFKPILSQVLGTSSFGAKINALVRTTMAFVELRAGDGAQNVLPREGVAGVNVRTLPDDTREDVLAHLHKVAGPDAQIEDVSAVVYPPLTVTSADDLPFLTVKDAIQQTLSHRASDGRNEVKDGSVTPISVYPFLLTGMTDSRWYHDIAPGRIVRFSPFALSFDELSMIHGTDERVAVSEYIDAVRFYHHLIYTSAKQHIVSN